MNYPWLDAYCCAKAGCEKDYKTEWEATRYMIQGKMFAMQGGDKEGRALISLKLEPHYGLSLRQDYPGVIIPGYYMNKMHWNSVYLDGTVPDALLQSLIDESYTLLFQSLPKKVQRIIAP